MRDQQQRWELLSEDMRRGNPPLNDPTKINIPMSASARIRFEPNSRDAINSRIWESLKYDTKEPNSKDIKESSNPVFFDVNPQSARNSLNSYNQQQQFFPDPPRPTQKRYGEDKYPPAPKQDPGLINNPYLQRLDAVADSRNMSREMRSAVYEDNRERDVEASKLLAERQFNYRNLTKEEEANIGSLNAYELLRPKVDDYNKTYRT